MRLASFVVFIVFIFDFIVCDPQLFQKINQSNRALWKNLWWIPVLFLIFLPVGVV